MCSSDLPSRDFSTCDVNLVVHASVGRARRRRRVSAAPDPHGGAALAAAPCGADSLKGVARSAWRALAGRREGVEARRREGRRWSAPALVFSAGEVPRRIALARAVALVRASVGPNLSRLARAQRLLVVVLDSSQSPVTYTHRAIAEHLEAIDGEIFGLRGIVERIEAALVPRAS